MYRARRPRRLGGRYGGGGAVAPAPQGGFENLETEVL